MASNGRLDRSTLTQVDGWAYLANATAVAWVGFCNEIEAMGYPRPTITAPDGAYRDIQQQHYWKAYWTGRGKPGNAATPGWSNHGWGKCVDIFNVYRYPRHIIVPVAAKWGFTFNVPSELWHMQHNGIMPAALPVTPIEEEEKEEDEMKPIILTNSKGQGIIINWAEGTWRGLRISETRAHEANGAVVTKAASDEDYENVRRDLRPMRAK